jgi:hypothetical protein
MAPTYNSVHEFLKRDQYVKVYYNSKKKLWTVKDWPDGAILGYVQRINLIFPKFVAHKSAKLDNTKTYVVGMVNLSVDDFYQNASPYPLFPAFVADNVWVNGITDLPVGEFMVVAKMDAQADWPVLVGK